MADEIPAVEGVEHRFVDANGLRVHVAEAGAQDAPPVLLLHGWPQHWYMWRRVMAGLRGEYRLLAPDLRGFGWTEAPGDGYDGETFAADQVALLDALGLERAHVVRGNPPLRSSVTDGRLQRAASVVPPLAARRRRAVAKLVHVADRDAGARKANPSERVDRAPVHADERRAAVRRRGSRDLRAELSRARPGAGGGRTLSLLPARGAGYRARCMEEPPAVQAHPPALRRARHVAQHEAPARIRVPRGRHAGGAGPGLRTLHRRREA
ncbi:MAG: alpha/beta fold hydrolase [Actinobacteria bacterium]|nr:MAG: alpha/beta fold hydrolase [Actinomycetota bacterium]